MQISYCISEHNRPELLNNTLESLARQKFPKSEYEVIVVDDNSTQESGEVCRKFKGKMNLWYVRLEHNFGWRDCPTALNFGLRRASGEVWATSFSEVVLSEYGLDVLYSAHFGKYQLNCQYGRTDTSKLCILLPPIDMNENQFKLEDLKEMKYEEVLEKYSPGIVKQIPFMQGKGDFCCMSMKKDDWLDIGGFYEFHSWGSVDIDIGERRWVRGLTDAIVNSPYGICIHQWHPKSEKALKGSAQMEYRPSEEYKMSLSNLTFEHEKEMKSELVADECWSL